MQSFFFIFLGFAVSASAIMCPLPAALPVSLENWQPRAGDRLVIDTKENEGYLIHTDGRHLNFPVITGQRKNVYYIGRYYFAATPERKWNVESMDIKSNRYTFGPSGRFLRFHYENDQTPYGIHEHNAEEVMFERNDRFQSMGCIIVKTEIMDILEKSFQLNEGEIKVITKYGAENPVSLAFS